MIIDLVVVAIVIVSAVISFLRGFIRETLTIAGIAGGLFAAVTFGPKLAPVFRNWFDVADDGETVKKLFDIVPMTIVADGLAYAAIFITVVILISVISHFISGAVKALGLGPVDRTLGVVFGIARAVLLLGLLYLPFHLLMDSDAKEKYFGESKTHYIIEKTSIIMTKFLPSSEEVKEKVDETESDIKKKLLENNFLDDGQLKTSPKKENDPETGYKTDERKSLESLIGENPTSEKTKSLTDFIEEQIAPNSRAPTFNE